MRTAINWDPSTPSLHEIHRQLTGRHNNWPEPQIYTAPITDEQRRRACRAWLSRARTTYVSVQWAASLSQQCLTLGAPLDILSGIGFTADELLNHLTVTLHLLEPLEPTRPVAAPTEFFRPAPDSPSWETIFQNAMELFVFNLNIAQPLYEGLAAVTSDPAMSELSTALAHSLDELTRFGQLALEWMSTEFSSQITASTKKRLPALLAAYETLCNGSPQQLDELAGTEITVETRPGNLGTLQPEHRAAIFYDTLNTAIFPALDNLGWPGLEAWQQHYRHRELPLSEQAVVAAVGLHPIID